MAQCDFYVQFSLYETFGVTLIEAMACGKPVVATDLPAMREKINDSRGILVPPRNVDALARALDVMLDHYPEYSADEIAQYVQNNYSYETVGLKLTKIYHEMIGSVFL
jgi:glycosyltransferase involved in cell wall biosynthesis